MRNMVDGRRARAKRSWSAQEKDVLTSSNLGVTIGLACYRHKDCLGQQGRCRGRVRSNTPLREVACPSSAFTPSAITLTAYATTRRHRAWERVERRVSQTLLKK